jgi:hypothetical protein
MAYNPILVDNALSGIVASLDLTLNVKNESDLKLTTGGAYAYMTFDVITKYSFQESYERQALNEYNDQYDWLPGPGNDTDIDTGGRPGTSTYSVLYEIGTGDYSIISGDLGSVSYNPVTDTSTADDQVNYWWI